MARYRKIPVIVDAWQWDGGILTTKMQEAKNVPEWIMGKVNSNVICSGINSSAPSLPILFIKTLEGTMEGSKNDYIIKGIKGEIYPCKPDIFEATYEQIEGN